MLKNIYEDIKHLRGLNWGTISVEDLKNTELKFNEKIREFETVVKQVNDPSIIKEVIDIEMNEDILPIPTVFVLFKKWIQLEKSAVVLQMFSNYLLLYGPDWEDEALSVKKEIELGNYSKASEIAFVVDYNKYQ